MSKGLAPSAMRSADSRKVCAAAKAEEKYRPDATTSMPSSATHEAMRAAATKSCRLELIVLSIGHQTRSAGLGQSSASAAASAARIEYESWSTYTIRLSRGLLVVVK